MCGIPPAKRPPTPACTQPAGHNPSKSPSLPGSAARSLPGVLFLAVILKSAMRRKQLSFLFLLPLLVASLACQAAYRVAQGQDQYTSG